MTQPGKVIIVEGLIGGGKTTLTRELGEALGPNTLVLFEPDEKDDANPYLADYYENPTRWSFVLQVHQLQARFRMHQHAQWHAMQGIGDALLDRSYFGDTAFARLQLHLGVMTRREFNTYASIYQAMTSVVMLPTVCLRILTTPEVCAKRIESRRKLEPGRECEKAVDLDYLRLLEVETNHMVDVLDKMGTLVWQVPWDTDRKTKEARADTVAGLVSRIRGIEPVDFFLNMHRRAL